MTYKASTASRLVIVRITTVDGDDPASPAPSSLVVHHALVERLAAFATTATALCEQLSLPTKAESSCPLPAASQAPLTAGERRCCSSDRQMLPSGMAGMPQAAAASSVPSGFADASADAIGGGSGRRTTSLRAFLGILRVQRHRAAESPPPSAPRRRAATSAGALTASGAPRTWSPLRLPPSAPAPGPGQDAPPASGGVISPESSLYGSHCALPSLDRGGGHHSVGVQQHRQTHSLLIDEEAYAAGCGGAGGVGGVHAVSGLRSVSGMALPRRKVAAAPGLDADADSFVHRASGAAQFDTCSSAVQFEAFAGAGQQGLALAGEAASGAGAVLQWLRGVGAEAGTHLLVEVFEWCDAGSLLSLLVQMQPGPGGQHYNSRTSSRGLRSGGCATDCSVFGFSTCASSRDSPPPPSGDGSAGLAAGRPLRPLITCRSATATILLGDGGLPEWQPPTSPPQAALTALPAPPPAAAMKGMARRAARIAALRCALHIAQGLAALHESGYFHTDLSPAAILCCCAPGPAPTPAAGGSCPRVAAAAAVAAEPCQPGSATAAAPSANTDTAAAAAAAAAPTAVAARAQSQSLLDQLVASTALGRVVCKVSTSAIAPIAPPGAHCAVADGATAEARRSPPLPSRGSGQTPLELSPNTSQWGALAYVPPEVVVGGWPSATDGALAAAAAVAAAPAADAAAAAAAPSAAVVERRPASTPGASGGGGGVAGGGGTQPQPAAASSAPSAAAADTLAAAVAATTPTAAASPFAAAAAYILSPAPSLSTGAFAAGAAANSYTWGLLLWQLLTGRTPHYELHPAQVLVGKATGDLDSSLEWPDDVEEGLRAVGEACLLPDPRRRPPMRAAVEAVEGALRRATAQAQQILQQHKC
ncbi:hypothetical protein TSOC_006630 [Tetrabaena socialis]|uniref:Protein kinase domain-containing protein n=1 Tax=Tetrabaena socialis TaxID=47790 RepID=A0A2J8A354_9CHLO|nr:hypothetical protein TSOC_006630 [Tetrabaena socialis]|eukprot:PNH06944.1 hypothetical protein TSOC_006630 [Tetrabaena socialis]